MVESAVRRGRHVSERSSSLRYLKYSADNLGGKGCRRGFLRHHKKIFIIKKNLQWQRSREKIAAKTVSPFKGDNTLKVQYTDDYSRF